MGRAHGSRKKAGRPPQSNMAVDPDTATLDPDMATEVEELFSKRRTFTKPSSEEWLLPDPNEVLTHPQQQHPELQALKASLNAVKSRLSDQDLSEWQWHTGSTNRAGKVIAALRSAANAEICTQAWCKFYEILGTFPLLPEAAVAAGALNTVHLCEAPGAFVSALNHYTQTSEATRYWDWAWAASTLNPYHEGNGGHATVADDRLIANTLPWWSFGSDNTGDLTSLKNLLQLQGFVAHMPRVDLVTADGSFDCLEAPDEQEALVASLVLCEAVAGLLLLSSGGALVLKMFTLYEHSSVCLLYLLNCCFSSVSVFKPATSKAGNSEVYVVGRGHYGKDAARPLVAKLLRSYGPGMADGPALFPAALIPASYLRQHLEVCSYFHERQVATITENLSLFPVKSAEQRGRLERLRDLTAQQYLLRFRVSFLPRGRWLSRGAVSPAFLSVAGGGRPVGLKRHMGSFNARRELRGLNWWQRLERGRHGDWVRPHCNEDGGGVLEGPADCAPMSWFTVAGAALSEAPACRAGQVPPPVTGAGPGRVAWWLGDQVVWAAAGGRSPALMLSFSEEPAFPRGGAAGTGTTVSRVPAGAAGVLLGALGGLGPGDAPAAAPAGGRHALTAGLVFCLRAAFRSVAFRCPSPGGRVGALLLCSGFCPEAAGPLLSPLADLRNHMERLAEGADQSSRPRSSRGAFWINTEKLSSEAPQPGGPAAWGLRSLGAPQPGGPAAWRPRSLGPPQPGGPAAWGTRSLGLCLQLSLSGAPSPGAGRVDGLEVSTGKVSLLQATNGSTVLLPCTYSSCIGIHKLYFNWHYNDNGTMLKLCEAVIPKENVEPVVGVYHERVEFVGSSRRNNISILLWNITFEDRGDYVCFARNPKEKNRNHSAVYTLIVVDQLTEVDTTLTTVMVAVVGTLLGSLLLFMVAKALVVNFMPKKEDKNKDCLVSSTVVDHTEDARSGAKGSKGKA
ncbi:unnamed protein product [Gadus morhua 'NCC']